MATTQHYLWASGHFLLLISALRCLVASISFRSAPPFWYKASFSGALLSYAIVCQKSIGIPQPNLTYLRRAMLDENVQYFLLAFFWWSSKPVTIALLPYTVFSLFHALTFVRTTIMPRFLAPSPPASAGGPPQPNPLAKRLQVWVKANYDIAMLAVAYIELLIFVRVLFGAMLLQNSLLSPIVYSHFLRQRYYQSTFTRQAVTVASRTLDRYASRPGNPPLVGQVWRQAKALIEKWAGSTLEPQPQPATVPRR